MKKVLLFTLLAICIGLHAIQITTYAISSYNADVNIMHSTLGIDSSYVIEDFEDIYLVSGLSVSYDTPYKAPFTVLPAVLNVYSASENNFWDGRGVIANSHENIWGGTMTNITKFHLPSNVVSFGVGLANFQVASNTLYVNGNFVANITSLPNFVNGSSTRNLYLKIEAQTGETINTVEFRKTEGDGLVWDHLAFKVGVVPEPQALMLVSLSLSLFFLRKIFY